MVATGENRKKLPLRDGFWGWGRWSDIVLLSHVEEAPAGWVSMDGSLVNFELKTLVVLPLVRYEDR